MRTILQRLAVTFILPFALAHSIAIAQSVPFTLEKIMSRPFPEELTPAPRGGNVSWVVNVEGRRNIWIAEAPDYRCRQLTNYNSDDGQELSDLNWSPDGKIILYVRGGGTNRQGEYPNPLSDPAGVEQTIWRVSVEGGNAVKIGEGSSPAISPRGDGVAFIRRGQIYWARLDSVKSPTQLIRARGNAGSLRWSPDGAQLAFVSNRGDHSFIVVYDVATTKLKFISPSVDRDSNPVWSPDGSKIVFIRIPATSRSLIFRAVRSAQPWSILVAEMKTNERKTIWTADEGTGSAFRGVVADNQLLWGAGERIIFPWEKDGWTHLYAVSPAEPKPILLTPGDFEVEYASLSPDRQSVLFNSNQNDIDRRHIWRVSVQGGNPTQLTKGKGIEWSPVMTADGKAILLLQSDARRPARVSVQMGSNEPRELAAELIPADFPLRSLVEPQQVVFSAADGMLIHGQLFLPSNLKKGERRPALLFFHGGSRRQMLLGWHYMYYYNNSYAMNQYLASQGFIVLSVNYRSGIGYGMEFREALNYGAGGASEFNDVVGAGLYLRSRDDVDLNRIGLWGGSYGGYLTALGLARASDLFAAGVDFHGVHDWTVGIRTFVPSYNPLERPDDARVAFESSPMASVDTWRSPVLLIHGDDDRNVSFSETVTLVEALRKRGLKPEQLIFPDDVHDFLVHVRWVEAYRTSADFFKRKLGK